LRDVRAEVLLAAEENPDYAPTSRTLVRSNADDGDAPSYLGQASKILAARFPSLHLEGEGKLYLNFPASREKYLVSAEIDWAEGA